AAGPGRMRTANSGMKRYCQLRSTNTARRRKSLFIRQCSSRSRRAMRISAAGTAVWTASPITWRQPTTTSRNIGERTMQHRIVSRDEWIAARKQHLSKEKELTRLRDELSRERRELPWVEVEKEHVFDGPRGKETLSDLFDGRSQLIVQHFM